MKVNSILILLLIFSIEVNAQGLIRSVTRCNPPATIPGNATCTGATISATPCSSVAGAVLNDDPATLDGIEYDWAPATSSVLGVGFGATTGTRALVDIGGQCWSRYNMDIYNSNWATYSDCAGEPWSGHYTANVVICQPCVDGMSTSEIAPNEGLLYKVFGASMSTPPITERTQGVCPDGWHIPSDCEFMYLENTLGMTIADQEASIPSTRNSGNVGSKLSNFTSGGSNSSGFSGLLAGATWLSSYQFRGTNGYFLTSSQTGPFENIIREMDSSSSGFLRHASGNTGFPICDGISLRCIKD